MSKEKGSQWNKWDLHVHTPYSVYQCFGQDNDETWESYISDLENLPAEFAVIGINDYLFLDGYERLKNEQNSNGRIPNCKLLPVIEFRIDKFAGVEFGPLKRINLHVIFSDDISIETIRDQFLNTLHQSYVLGDGQKWQRTVTKESLEELGKKIIESAPENERSKYNTELIEGFNNLNISEEQIFNSLQKDCFENKYLIAIGKTEWAALKWSDSSIATKKTIINSADLIFTAAQSNEEFYKGKEQLKKNGVKDLLLDCSDAHYFSNSSDKDRIGNCSTWIKADATFEGLKQALIEPTERIYIGKEPEIFDRILQNKTKYIKQIEIYKSSTYENQYGKWFDNVKIELNPELVAIIGNKGSGKSALADIMALCGNFNKPNSFSFLHSKKFRKGNLAKHFTGTLTWMSGGSQTRILSNDPEADNLPNVKYLPQGDFEDLTNEIEKTQSFQNEIESVVFSHLEEDERLTFKNFNELIESRKIITEKEVKIIQNEIEELNTEIIKLERKKNPRYESELQGHLKQKNEELKALVAPIEIKDPNSDTLLVGINKEILEKIEEIRSEIDNLKTQINSKKEQKQELQIEKTSIQNLIQEIKLKEQELNTFQNEYSNFLIKYNLKIEDIIALKINFSKLEEISKLKNSEILDLETEIGNNQDKQSNSLLNKLQLAEQELQNEQSKLDSTQKDYQNYLQEKSVYELRKKEIEGSTDKPNTIKYFEGEIHYVTYDIDNDIAQKRKDRLELVKKIFNLKLQIIKIYQKVKKRIDDKIDDNKSLLANYNINIEASLVFRNDFDAKFFHYIYLNKVGSFYGKESAYVQLMKIKEDCDVNNFEDIERFLTKIIDLLNFDNRENQNNEKRYIDDQINNMDEFYMFLFSLDYLDFNYKLKLGDKDLDQLSPGERGALLLVFYLLLDKNDIPLILDQPEDNLDNHSVANVLVPFIRRAKQKRQIILVTHNPNLAVVADAEQVIWVDIDKQDKNKFKYLSGSIENRDINEKIVNVLEGAMPAFNKRKQKYYE